MLVTRGFGEECQECVVSTCIEFKRQRHVDMDVSLFYSACCFSAPVNKTADGSELG